MSNFDEILSAARTKSVPAKASTAKAGDSVNQKAEPSAQLASYKRVLVLEQIRDRPHKDTRPINPHHVEELIESISALSLIQPIAVDRYGHLLAGGHRREALAILQVRDPDTFEKHFPGGQIPVRVYDFDASHNESLATAIEAAENEKRRDYTPTEVRELAERLVAAGYQEVKGRPTRNQKALKPALATIIGKSTKTVQRYLNQDTQTPSSGNESPKGGQLSTFSKWTRTLSEIEKQAPEMLSEGEELAQLAGQLKAKIQKMSN